MNNLRKLRKEKKVSLADLSKIIGVTAKTVSRWEKDESAINKKNAILLANYFEVSVPYLLGLDENVQLRDPSSESLFYSIHRKLTKGSLISNEIDEWTPFKTDISLLLSEFLDTKVLETYIDFLTQGKGYNPIVVNAFKKKITRSIIEFPLDVNTSSAKDSFIHEVWEEWVESEEYKQKFNSKK